MAKSIVEVKFNQKKLAGIRRQLAGFPRALPKVVSRAINRTATSAKVETARQMRDRVQLKVSDIKRAIKLRRATRSRWQAEVSVTGRRIPLYQFAARQTKTGVSYKIDRAGGRKSIKSAFIATMASGHTGVFKRKGSARLAILELRGPSLGVAFEGAPGLLTRVLRSANKNLEKNIDDQVRLILGKGKAVA